MQFFFHLSIIIMTNPETSETNILGVLRRRHGAKAPGTPQEQGLPPESELLLGRVWAATSRPIQPQCGRGSGERPAALTTGPKTPTEMQGPRGPKQFRKRRTKLEEAHSLMLKAPTGLWQPRPQRHSARGTERSRNEPSHSRSAACQPASCRVRSAGNERENGTTACTRGLRRGPPATHGSRVRRARVRELRPEHPEGRARGRGFSGRTRKTRATRQTREPGPRPRGKRLRCARCRRAGKADPGPGKHPCSAGL